MELRCRSSDTAYIRLQRKNVKDVYSMRLKLDTVQSIRRRVILMRKKSENAIVKSGVSREEIFLTTKVWIEHYGYEEAKKSVEESMRKLQTNYLDLVLLHQPFADAYGAYHALEDLYEEGKIRAIGISNFYVDRMIDFASLTVLSR